MNGFYDLFQRLDESEDRSTADKELRAIVEKCRLTFKTAMADDLNTPAAIAALQGLKGDVNKLLINGLTSVARKEAREEFRLLGSILGLFQLNKWQLGPHIGVIGQAVKEHTAQPITPSKSKAVGLVTETDEGLPITVKKALTDDEIKELLKARVDARSRKDFHKADRIRDELKSQGIIIEDKPDGTARWKR